MHVNSGVLNYYTDILCHEFSPSDSEYGGTRMAIGTNFGDVYLIGDDDAEKSTSESDDSSSMEFEKSFSPACVWQTSLTGKEDEPVVSLCWDGDKRLFLLSNKYVYFMGERDLESGSRPQRIFGPLSNANDFMHFAILHNSGDICLVSDDWKTRIIDKETQQLKLEIQGHRGIAQVCKATPEYVATGGLDGYVHLYDPQFRTDRQQCSFGDSRNSINNMDISRNSVWLALSGVESSNFPTVYNIRSGKEVPFTPSVTKATETEQISAVHFDSKDSLYWGGSAGSVFKSDDLLISHSELKASYGLGCVPQILSIDTRDLDSGGTQLSVAGATNAVLFSSRGLFWDSMIHLEPNVEEPK